MRTLAPNARGGRLELNFDLTTPELPCERVTRLGEEDKDNKKGTGGERTPR